MNLKTLGCEKVRVKLLLFRDDKIDDETYVAINSHLAQCKECRLYQTHKHNEEK